MEKIIELLVNTEDVARWHRGMTGTIGIVDNNGTKQYEVKLKSKYKLKSGYTRMKFVVIKELTVGKYIVG